MPTHEISVDGKDKFLNPLVDCSVPSCIIRINSGRLFNAHHDEYGFQPIVVFDGKGRMIAAVLHPAARPYGRQTAKKLPHSRRQNTALTHSLA